MKSISVVTSIVGDNRDLLIDEQPIDESVDYIAYTNQLSTTWDTKEPCDIFKENSRNAKIHKVLIHKYVDSDTNFWIDGTIGLKMKPSDIVNEVLTDEYDMAVLENDSLQFLNIFDEGEFIIHNRMARPEIVCEQLSKYSKLNGNPKMTNNKLIIRRNSPVVNKFNEAWWAEISRYSSRDQLSFGYVLNQFPIRVNYLKYPDHLKYFRFYRHEKIRLK